MKKIIGLAALVAFAGAGGLFYFGKPYYDKILAEKNAVFFQPSNKPEIAKELEQDFQNFYKNYIDEPEKGKHIAFGALKDGSSSIGVGASGNRASLFKAFVFENTDDPEERKVTVSTIQMNYKKSKKGYIIDSAKILEDEIIVEVSTPTDGNFKYNSHTKKWDTDTFEKRNIPIVYDILLRKWHPVKR